MAKEKNQEPKAEKGLKKIVLTEAEAVVFALKNNIVFSYGSKRKVVIFYK